MISLLCFKLLVMDINSAVPLHVLSSALLLHLAQLSNHHTVLCADQLMGHLQFTIKLLSAGLSHQLAAQKI